MHFSQKEACSPDMNAAAGLNVSPFPLRVSGALQSDGHFHAQQRHARQQQPIEGLLFDGHHAPHRHRPVRREQEAAQQSQQDVQEATHRGAADDLCTEDRFIESLTLK